jgi:hypothetical protein
MLVRLEDFDHLYETSIGNVELAIQPESLPGYFQPVTVQLGQIDAPHKERRI